MEDITEPQDSPFPRLTLLDVLAPWPVISEIASHLPAGSLLALSRTNTEIRFILHGFQPSWRLTPPPRPLSPPAPTVIPTELVDNADKASTPTVNSWPNSLHVGFHQTSYWRHLKSLTDFSCAESRHTKGERVRGCLSCGMPVCEACIVKNSIGLEVTEGTFKKRVRGMCQGCWSGGRRTRERRFRDSEEEGDGEAARSGELCSCQSRDGWLCMGCKERHNREWGLDRVGDGSEWREQGRCFGEGCQHVVGPDPYRRRVCAWCERPVGGVRTGPRARISFEALGENEEREGREKARRDELEEYGRERRRGLRMSRRMLRGDREEDVVGAEKADEMVFVKDLDAFNYERLCGLGISAGDVYSSKHGTWRYARQFLLCFGEKSWATVSDEKERDLREKMELTGLSKTNRQVSEDGFVEAGLQVPSTHRDASGEDDEPEATDSETDEGSDREGDSSDSDASPGLESGKKTRQRPNGFESDDERQERRHRHPRADQDEVSAAPVDELTEEDLAETSNEGVDLGVETLPHPEEAPPEYGADTLILESGGDVVEE